MTKIKLIEQNSSTNYIISVNNTVLAINNWKEGYKQLSQLIEDFEESLLYKDTAAIHKLADDYNLNTPFILFLLSETAYRPLFLDYFNHCGQSFMISGKYFTKQRFCNFIHRRNNKTYVRKFKKLFDEAENHLYKKVLLPNLTRAFNKNSCDEVHKIYKTLSLSRFLHLAMSKLDKPFTAYLHFCAGELFQGGKRVSYSSLCRKSFSTTISYRLLDDSQRKVFMNVLHYWESKYKSEKEQFNMKLGQFQWILFQRDVQLQRTVSLDFNNINHHIKLEIQQYLHDWYKKGEAPKTISRRFYHIRRIANGLELILPECKSFLEVNYVDVLRLIDVLQEMKTKSGTKKYSLKSIQASISESRLLFDWLKSKRDEETLKNPFRRFRFHNINRFVKNAQYIPEAVTEQLTSVIHECSPSVQRIWLIMMNTGMRASEVLHLKEDCLTYNNKENIYYLHFLTHKTLKHRRRLGLEDHHKIPVLSNEMVDIIKHQIKETEYLRDAGKTPYIFVTFSKKGHTHDKQVTLPLGTTISSSINSCIRRHQITDNSGELWHYSNHQCRKTLAVKLLNEGSNLSDVGEILGHMVEKTTRQYYQDVDALKIAELDQQLFEQLFDTVDKDIRESYTPQEIDQLKKEIMLGSRETPEGHGSCLKHVSFGPCKKRSCVGCSLLLTGPQKLPMWRKLHEEQQIYINSMVEQMKKQGIENYESYRDYQSEYHLLSLYHDTITKLEKFMKERIPKHEF
ncbi:tyrosine-type recombinase/integrase [Salibacterium qingdaonense]|uniref:Site-specific recombinase XerD n=1 Tax=Salibacterium qingdaonense TaxID=266892 RepID=A0A1I4IMY7_9BACI|nr:site-specific integrase [Salibacterium qingdaonense]SFL55712.1 Site-specific recombinase XerD [Salibacterium qingdaonense]